MASVTKYYIEKARAIIAAKEGKVPSDYRMAKLLGISQPNMTRIMRHDQEISDENAVKLAELAGVPAAEIISQIHLKRAHETKNTKLAEIWEKMSQMAKTGALAGVMGAALVGSQFVASPTGAKSLVSSTYAAVNDKLFVLCQILQKRLLQLFDLPALLLFGSLFALNRPFCQKNNRIKSDGYFKA